ncbi:DNA-binding transcriptional ArsR family regulator [Rhodococcus sp. 27YEA15]|uniref:transcriptional regulator n=1 Tax=Rhodococcus sp. 27YEA15 TaxID=3156259 RepID=UPI003C7A84D2
MQPSSSSHPYLQLDDTVHQKARLAILSILAGGVEVDFGFLRSTLELTDGNLGRHLDVLLTAGYICVRRTYNGRRARSWLTITDGGRAALAVEVDALRSMLGQISDFH